MTIDAVDAHMHLWKVTENDWYPTLREMAEQFDTQELYCDFLLEDYQQAVGDLSVRKYVHVSAVTAPRAYLAETRWVDAIADREGLDLVIIGSVESTLSEVQIVADLERQAASRRFRGVRVLYDFEPSSPAAKTVLAWLERNGYVFDLVTQPESMSDWIETLAGYPELAVVLEHTGWPVATDPAGHEQWWNAMKECSRRTDALCKISGLRRVTLDRPDSLRRWVEDAVELFGWDRIAYGSNMPIETMIGTHSSWFGAVREVMGRASDAEQRKFYCTNAETRYRM